MAQPTFRRFWVEIHPDGSASPQFDPFTGKSHETSDAKRPVAQVLFYPISPGLAEKIRAQGDVAEPSELPVLSFEAPPCRPIDLGRRPLPDFYRTGTLRYYMRRICGFCEAEFGPDVEVCPRCLAKNQWYCGTCDTLISAPIVDRELDQVRCPVCEKTEPRGLKMIRCIGDFNEEKLYTHYVLEIDGHRHLILDYKLKRKQ